MIDIRLNTKSKHLGCKQHTILSLIDIKISAHQFGRHRRRGHLVTS